MQSIPTMLQRQFAAVIHNIILKMMVTGHQLRLIHCMLEMRWLSTTYTYLTVFMYLFICSKCNPKTLIDQSGFQYSIRIDQPAEYSTRVSGL